MKKSTVRQSLSILLISIVVLLALGCSKGNNSETSSPSKSLLARLPASAFALQYTDLSSDAYKKWSSSPAAALGAFLSELSQTRMTSADGGTTLLDAVKTTGLIPGGTGVQILSSAVGFATNTPSNSQANAPKQLGFGYYATAAAGFDLRQKMPALEDVLKAHQISPIRKSEGALEVLTADLPSNAAGVPASVSRKLFAIASDGVFAVSTDEQIARQGLNPSTTFLSSTSYQNIQRELAGKEQFTFAISYADLREFANSEALTTLDPEKRAEAQAVIQAIPIEYVAGFSTMKEFPGFEFHAPLTSDAQKLPLWQAILRPKGAMPTLALLPSSRVLTIGIDGSLLQAVKENLISTAEPANRAKVAQELTLLDSISSVALIVSPAEGAAPFPQAGLIFSSSQAAAIPQLVENIAKQSSSSAKLPVSAWQQKDVDGVTVRYMNSPLGVGAFVGSDKDIAFVGSTEGFVRGIIAARKGGATQPPAEFNAPMLAGGSLDFGKLSQVIGDLQGTLAMFTGGQDSSLNAVKEKLSMLGEGTLVVKLENNRLSAEGLLRDAVKK